MQLGLSEPPQTEMLSSRKRSCSAEPVFPKKLPRMERLVGGPGPLGLSKAISLSRTFQKEPIKYTEALFSYHLNGKGTALPPLRRSPKNSVSQIIHPFNAERQLSHDILYRTENMAFPVEGSRISVPQEHSTESLFKPYKRNVQNCSPSALGIHTPTALRKLTPHSRSPPGLVIPKPIYGHRPCCMKSGYTSGPCYSIDHALPRINRSISNEEWLRQYGPIALLQRKAHEGLIEERIRQLEQKGAKFPMKEANPEFYCPTGSAENLRIPTLAEPKFIAPYLHPSPSLLNYSSTQISNLQPLPNVNHGKPPSLSGSINEVQEVALSNQGVFIRINQDDHGHPVLSFPQENMHADTIASDVGGKCTEGVSSNVKKGIFRKPMWQREDPRFLFMDVPVPSSPAHRPFLRPFEQSPHHVCKIYSRRGQQDSSLFSEEPVSRLHGQRGDWPACVQKAQIRSSPEHLCQSHGSGAVERLQPYSDNEYMCNLAREKCNVLVKNRSDDDCSSKEALHHPTTGKHPKRTDRNGEKPEHAERASSLPSEVYACKKQRSSDCNKSFANKLSLEEHSEDADSIRAVKTPKTDGEKVPQEEEHELQASSSPPMPVINNVFSLAPCQSYLEKQEKVQKVKAEVTLATCSLQKCDDKGAEVHRRLKKTAVKKSDADVVTVSSYGAVDLCVKTEKRGGLLRKSQLCTDGLDRVGNVQNQVPQHKSSEPSFLTLSFNSAPPPRSHAETTFSFQPVPGQYLKLSAFKNVLPDIFTAGGKEAHLSAQRSTNDSKQAHHLFMKVHLSLCRHISSSVSCTKEQELRAWLAEGEMDRTPSVCPLLGASVREIWLRCQDTAAALSQVICQLENFVSCHQCPFPHVIRAGTIFIPMLVVKEVLFPDIPGELIDQVLQEHRIELRPTTLSEERHLMQLQKRTCSSKQRRLLSLRQLPDIYPDILNLFYLTCVKERLGSASPDGSQPSARVSAGVSVGPRGL
ncbi:uncharacterized protein LOC108941281 [Scleropages formosus]|uniref:Si:dkey-73n10.1 n=1 Tax=Scleropages formosus TaxID=113540 RepID=A0A8C9V810_SCLFO|nr:uncharacterized protein LOC108941281 [Scleropages formosus]